MSTRLRPYLLGKALYALTCKLSFLSPGVSLSLIAGLVALFVIPPTP